MSEELFKQWIGKERVEYDVVSQKCVNSFLATFNKDKTDTMENGITPYLFHWLLFPELLKTSVLGRDGHYIDERLLPPVGKYRRMWGASEIHFHKPLFVGDKVKRISTLTDVFSKRGKTENLIFVIIFHDLQVNEESILTDCQSLLYREENSVLNLISATKESEDKQWQFQQKLTPDSVFLFRYSAITFNAHRIHYDRNYVREVENYPDVVVHGPLIATLLLELAISQYPQDDISTFSFRMFSSAFVNEKLTLAGNRDAGVINLSAFTSDFRKISSATVQLKP